MTRKCPSCGEFTGTAHQCPVVQRRADVNDLDPQPSGAFQWLSRDPDWVARQAGWVQKRLIDWAEESHGSHSSFSQNRIAKGILDWAHDRGWVQLSESEANELARQVMDSAHGQVVKTHTNEGRRFVAFDHELHLLNEDECVCCDRRAIRDGDIDSNGLCETCRSWDDNKTLSMSMKAEDIRQLDRPSRST